MDFVAQPMGAFFELAKPRWFEHIRADLQMRGIKRIGKTVTEEQAISLYNLYLNWFAQGGSAPSYAAPPEGPDYYQLGVADPAMDASGMVAWFAGKTGYDSRVVEVFLSSMWYLHHSGKIVSEVFRPASPLIRDKLYQELNNPKDPLDPESGLIKAGMSVVKLVAVIAVAVAISKVIAVVPRARTT